MPKLAGISDRVDAPLYDGAPILAARLKSPLLRKTRQGVPDLNAALSNNLRGGYNGRRTSCPHKTPDTVPTYAVDETVEVGGLPVACRATYCSGCGARLWDDQDA
jgi:hypothetical protein